MTHPLHPLLRLLLLVGTVTATAQERPGDPPAAAAPRPFYAMDNSFMRPGLDLAGQLDLVKELGFAGVAWREQPVEQVAAAAAALSQRGLTMFAIYCAARVTADGDLTHSPDLPKLMAALKGHPTIVWLHIGGKGPALATLTGDEPAVKRLRQLADVAAAHGLRVAVYPHYGEWTARFEDATRLAQAVNHERFGVTFNLCHALAAGEERRIPELLESARGVLMTVTLNGADAGVTGPKWDRLIRTLDQGTFDARGLLRKLDDIRFNGPVGFQSYNIPGDAKAVLTPTMAVWRELTRVPLSRAK
jgi:sugar phosphate isomerase/epimerase